MPVTAITAVTAFTILDVTMATMTSLQAQNRFGEMLDTSQREPVVITRRGRPVSIVLSVSGDPSDLQYQWMRTMSNLYPLRGREAIDAIN